MDQNNCLICLDTTLTYSMINCGCKIYVHEKCLDKWVRIKNTCLICKKKIYSSSRIFKLRWNYFISSFEKSILVKMNEHIIDYITNHIKNNSDSINKFIFLNMIFSIGIILLMIPTILYIGFISQIKYFIDVRLGKQIPSYKMYRIHRNVKNKKMSRNNFERIKTSISKLLIFFT